MRTEGTRGSYFLGKRVSTDDVGHFFPLAAFCPFNFSPVCCSNYAKAPFKTSLGGAERSSGVRDVNAAGLGSLTSVLAVGAANP